MPWPLSQDYNEAIQSPAVNFADPDLCRGRPVTNALGIPMPRSGTFADVYQLRCPAGDFAVKCFTGQLPGLCERCAAIGKHLRSAALPFTVDFQYLPEGIRVLGRWYPVLKMRWVEGLLLNHFVRDNLERPATLAALADIWVRMARRLRTSSVAHGDLQHANIILAPERDGASHALRLVDYDGMWVTALAGQKSGEVGHPNYQHPQRLCEAVYGPEVDRFPLLVIYCAVRGLLVGGRALWERYDNGDNLLFKEADLRAPRGSALVWELARLNDPELRRLVDSLSRAAYKSLDQVPHLGDLLAGKQALASADGPSGAPARKRATHVVLTPSNTAGNDPSSVEAAPAPRGEKRARVWLLPAAAGALTLAGVVLAIFFLARHLGGRSHPTAEPVIARGAEGVKAEAPAAEPNEPRHRPASEPERPPAPERQPEVTSDPKPETKREPPAGPKPPPKPSPSPGPMPEPRQERLLAQLALRLAKEFAQGAVPAPKPARPAEPKPPPQPKPKPEERQAKPEPKLGAEGRSNPPKGPPAEKCPSPPAGPAHPTVVHRFEGLTERVLCLAFSPDGRRCLSGDQGGTVRLWDVETGEELRSVVLGASPVTTLAFSGDSRTVYAAGPTAAPAEKPNSFLLTAWDSDTGRVRHSMRSVRSAKLAMPTLLAFSPSGRRFVIIESVAAPPGPPLCQAESLDLGNVRAGGSLAVEPNAGATCVALAPDGLKALTGGARGDAAVRLWDLKSGIVQAFGGLTTGVRCVALAPDLRYALTDHRGNGIQVWKLARDRWVRAGVLAGHTGAVTCLALSPDGRQALSASQDKTVRWWDVRAGRELDRLKGHADVVHAVAFSPDGRRALTGGADKAVLLWELTPPKTRTTGPPGPHDAPK
jgi:hypothetical protein